MSRSSYQSSAPPGTVTTFASAAAKLRHNGRIVPSASQLRAAPKFPAFNARPLQAFGEADHRGWDAGRRSDPRLASALRHLEIDLPHVGADDFHIIRPGEEERLVRVFDADVGLRERLLPLRELVLVHPVHRHDEVRRRTIVEELPFMPRRGADPP